MTSDSRSASSRIYPVGSYDAGSLIHRTSESSRGVYRHGTVGSCGANRGYPVGSPDDSTSKTQILFK